MSRAIHDPGVEIVRDAVLEVRTVDGERYHGRLRDDPSEEYFDRPSGLHLELSFGKGDAFIPWPAVAAVLS